MPRHCSKVAGKVTRLGSSPAPGWVSQPSRPVADRDPSASVEVPKAAVETWGHGYREPACLVAGRECDPTPASARRYAEDNRSKHDRRSDHTHAPKIRHEGRCRQATARSAAPVFRDDP